MDSAELARLFSDHAQRTDGRGLTRFGVLSRLFEKVWCRETASPGCQAAWHHSNPAWGQCAVTALAIQDMCGGELVRATVEPYGSHYWNRLPNGEGARDYDVTRCQFPEGTVVPAGQPVDRAYALDSERALAAGTRKRYELLSERLAEAMRSL